MKARTPLSPLALEALVIIINCETALDRPLCAGERRDLLKDNTSWHNDVVAAVVEEIGGLQ